MKIKTLMTSNQLFEHLLKSKNTFLTALLVLGLNIITFAQDCIPYAPVTVGYYPPSDNLPCAVNGTFYDVVISYKGHPNSVYTAYVNSITNLPPGLTASYPTNSLLPGGLWCARISGIPSAPCGQYKVLINISLPQVGITGELSALSDAYPSFFFATEGDNSNRIIRVTDNNCQPVISPQPSDFLATFCGVLCSNSLSVSPQVNAVGTGNAVIFVANTTDPNPSYIWQSDFGQGFQTLNNYGNYSGVNTNALTVNNVQLSEHNQPIRAISASGNCIDTSNVAYIHISDTCINTINDTIYTTVTDTLIIHTTLAGINPPNNQNTIKVFPNPASTHITIDYGNFAIMSGYQLMIENSVGLQVFQTNINHQSDYISLSNWSGNGLYFVHIIDPQGNTIDVRKIVLL